MRIFAQVEPQSPLVPAQAGIQFLNARYVTIRLGPRFRLDERKSINFIE